MALLLQKLSLTQYYLLSKKHAKARDKFGIQYYVLSNIFRASVDQTKPMCSGHSLDQLLGKHAYMQIPYNPNNKIKFSKTQSTYF